MARPPDKFLKVEDWRELARSIAQQQEYEARDVARRANRRWFAPLFLLPGLGLLGWGLQESHTAWRLESWGTRAPGIVSSLEAGRSDPNHLAVTYRAIVTYTTNRGQQISFRDAAGSTRPLYRTGDTVTVLYDSGRPGRAIIDRGVLRNWLPAVLLYVLGGLFSLIGIRIVRAA